jgi:hypothetical protein
VAWGKPGTKGSAIPGGNRSGMMGDLPRVTRQPLGLTQLSTIT